MQGLCERVTQYLIGDGQLTAAQLTAAAPCEGVWVPFWCLASGVPLLGDDASPGMPASADVTAAMQIDRTSGTSSSNGRPLGRRLMTSCEVVVPALT